MGPEEGSGEPQEPWRPIPGGRGAGVAGPAGFEQGNFFKPLKRLKSFRIDADVLAYFESQGKGYQATVNRVLREAMLRGLRKAEPGRTSAKRHVRKA